MKVQEQRRILWLEKEQGNDFKMSSNNERKDNLRLKS
jgi:hypothetical protein